MTSVLTITPAEFCRFQKLIHREAGIHLTEAKQSLLTGRLVRVLRELALTSFTEYYERVVSDPAELVRMIDCVSTNETHFFREPRQFAHLEREVYPRWIAAAAAGKRPRHIRVWSAACSSGEEPYSIAMSLRHHFPGSSGWTIEIFASDISTRMLDRARNAVWPASRAKEVPTYARRFLLRGVRSQAGNVTVVPEIGTMVRFFRANLNADRYPVTGRFDVIFCRNVLIYFDAATKARVVSNLLAPLTADGLLLLGHSESLHDVPEAVTAGPMMYALRHPRAAASCA